MKNYSHCDDVVDVTGVMSKDNLLFVGSNSMPFLKKHVNEMVVKQRSELESEFVRHKVFDRIFVDMRDMHNVFDRSLVEKIIGFNCGTISFFVEDDDVRSTLKDFIDTNWWPADTWEFATSVGSCVMTNARGSSTAPRVDDDE